MPTIGDRRLVYFESEEHLVRRLGAALVVCWSELDQSVRDMLIDRAERVLDGDEADEFQMQLKQLVAEHGNRH